MAIQYVDRNADAVGTVGDTYNISASNNNFQVTIDGGSTQDFVLTNGSARTAAQIVTDLAGLTGATASVVTVNGVNHVRIRTTSASGAASSILIGAPSNNANSALGFVATTYTGGANVNTTFTGGTKQQIINGIESALTGAGWITISGSGTTNLLMQSSMTPASQNLRMRLRVKDNGNNCAVCTLENVSGARAGTSSTTAGGHLFPATGKGFRVIANKYQAFVLVPGSVASREFVAFGVPYLPTFLQGTIYEAMWLQGNATSDTDSTSRMCFRNALQVTGLNSGFHSNILNGNLVENNAGGGSGAHSLVTTTGAYQAAANGLWIYRWHDGSVILSDPLISWGMSANADEGMIRGQLWDAFISSEIYPCDTTLSNVDSRNWNVITNNNNGGNVVTIQYNRGTLCVVIP